GTLYYVKYQGVADVDFLNRLGLDALALGNHAFDQGPEHLAGLLENAAFPPLMANAELSKSPALAVVVKPYVIKEVGAEKVAIIGLITPTTSEISSPGDSVNFTNVVSTANAMVAEVQAQGVDKIILLTHLGASNDMSIAQQISGVDVIVGGHSHTLLGDFRAIGWATEAGYPLETFNADQEKVCVVQAGSKAMILGQLEVTFDDLGRVTHCGGKATLLIADDFSQENTGGQLQPVSDQTKASLLAGLQTLPTVEFVAVDTEAQQHLDTTYKAGIADLLTQPVAEVLEDIWNVTLPGGVNGEGVVQPGGSHVAPLVARAMVEKAQALGQPVVAGFTNAGGVRAHLLKGQLTMGRVYEVLPFSNTLVVLDVTGAELWAALEVGAVGTGSFAYIYGARYQVDFNQPFGSRVASVDVADSSPAGYSPLDLSATYRVVTNSYLADGGNGYEMLKSAGDRVDTGLGQAEVFAQWATEQQELTRPEETGVSLVQ
ncbi:MAG: 5'-nucleotidase C-terminal domain-containing protein, partial [Deltaproteobacteria bacterium]|nr:5'-nucleotidase C-terminal domain-containing protein [Deltaproteobacteria bacterium]